LTDLPSLITNEQGPCALMARGAWTVAHVERLERLCAGGGRRNGTVGAWLFEKLARSGVAGSPEAIFVGASPSYSGLLREVRELNRQDRGSERRENPLVDRMTKMARDFVADGAAFLHMLGAISFSLGRVLRQPRSFRLTSTVYQLGRVGWQAILITSDLPR